MNDVTRTIRLIQAAVEDVGLSAFSLSAAVPYTTLLHWKKHAYRPKVLATFEKLAVAAERHSDPVEAPQEPAAKPDAA